MDTLIDQDKSCPTYLDLSEGGGVSFPQGCSLFGWESSQRMEDDRVGNVERYVRQFPLHTNAYVCVIRFCCKYFFWRGHCHVVCRAESFSSEYNMFKPMLIGL